MRIKQYDELTFADDFMFCKVLENNEDLCRELVELILDTKIEIVTSVRRQKPIEITPDGKGMTEFMSLRCRMGIRKNCPDGRGIIRR